MKAALLVAAAASLAAAEPPRLPVAHRASGVLASPVDLSGIRRATFTSIEKRMDKRLMSIPPNDPCELLGGTRGLYVEGFGGVFTAEVSLAFTPGVSPFRPEITAADKERVWIRKVKALPVLRDTMKEMVVGAADALAMIPANEQVVLAVRILFLSWEKTDTLPGQIVMRGERSALMRSGAAAIRVEEF
jgi:hypothetical protein